MKLSSSPRPQVALGLGTLEVNITDCGRSNEENLLRLTYPVAKLTYAAFVQTLRGSCCRQCEH